MTKRLVFLVIGCSAALAATSMRRVAQVRSGPYHDGHGRVVCCDSDHDSLPELVFHTGTIHPSDPLRIEVWEHQGWNRFSLVFADTGEYPEPPGITTGNAIPFAAGDIDGDGLADIVCVSIDKRDSGLFYDIVMTLESPDSFSYPCSLSWYYRYANNCAIPVPVYYPPDLDQDGHKEIVMFANWVWENVGDNQNELVWQDSIHARYRSTFGDFDGDEKMNFASASLGSDGTMSVWECTGDDQYGVMYQDTVRQPNGADVFTTNDIDGDSLPEFYVAYENVPRGKIYLCMWESNAAGIDSYHRTLVDSVSFSGDDWGRISECGDVDGDGIDECIWTTPDIIKMYKAVRDDQLQEVWHWDNDHGGFRSLVSTVYDINNDGYNELITAGNAKISVFEIDAVDLVFPNGGSYPPDDTVWIRWRVNTPPRCDSLSLFLRRDSLWNLDTIARGLPATDSLYQWVIPASVPDTGRIVVIAYGPGWQFDISDSVIHFAAGGVAEGIRTVPLQWSLLVSPNPARGAFTVRYDVPDFLSPRRLGGASSGARFLTSFGMTADGAVSYSRVSLGIYDASGRLVRSLATGEVPPGRYAARLPTGVLPAGVYFCILDNGAKRFNSKVILTE